MELMVDKVGGISDAKRKYVLKIELVQGLAIKPK